jgi:hypothetical protein
MVTYLHSIYGGGTNYFTLPSIIPVDTCCKDALLALSSLFSALENAVMVFFPSSSIIAPLVAPMGATVKVSDKVFVRLTWCQQNPGIVFQSDSLFQLLQIKDLYLQFGMDYTNDPLFKSGLGLTLL